MDKVLKLGIPAGSLQEATAELFQQRPQLPATLVYLVYSNKELHTNIPSPP